MIENLSIYIETDDGRTVHFSDSGFGYKYIRIDTENDWIEISIDGKNYVVAPDFPQRIKPSEG